MEVGAAAGAGGGGGGASGGPSAAELEAVSQLAAAGFPQGLAVAAAAAKARMEQRALVRNCQ